MSDDREAGLLAEIERLMAARGLTAADVIGALRQLPARDGVADDQTDARHVGARSLSTRRNSRRWPPSTGWSLATLTAMAGYWCCLASKPRRSAT